MVGIGWTACANNPLRTSPYPLEANDVFINPASLLVPPSMREGDLLQFNLSKDRRFRGNDDILSEPVPWGVFNPHRVLDEGKWYWRFRSVDKDGTEHPWSKTYSFTIKPGTPQFATPQFSDFLAGIPEEGPRIYCFLREGLEEARRTVRSHPEFSNMIEDGRRALAMSFTTDTVPYKHVFEMSESCDMLNTAYQMLGRKIYADKMVQNLRCLLPENPTDEFLANDFNAGELVYVLACTYETCGDLLAPAERRRTEELILEVISRYYHERLVGQTENRFFDEHIWQFTVRRFVQGCLVTYGKYPEAKEYLQYFYELWTSRAPATGFNRDGAWQNGANYFSANAVSLMYLPKLFGYATGTDFLQHPWYRNAGKGVACTWLPGSLSSGFGDGHEKMNEKPLRIRSAFADFLARVINRLTMFGAIYLAVVALLPAITSGYRLLDSGAALGRGNGPLLVRRRGERTPLRRIAVPGLHTTANALVARLFPEIGERVPLLFSEIAAAVERGEYDVGVLIHEGRFVYGRRNLELVADLGLEWERRTSLPLPLGGIVMRRSLGEDAIGRFDRLLRRSIEYAFAHPDVSRPFVKEHAQELDDDVIDKHIALFVNVFSLSLGRQGHAAMAALTGAGGL